MEKKMVIIVGAFTILSAIFWGAVILQCSYALKGTECYQEIKNTLALGASMHIILIWGPLGAISTFATLKNKLKK